MNPARRANCSGTIRTLIVDDAPLMRRAIQQILKNQDGIEVVGTAANGRECLEKIPILNPDVVTLDIDMPVMNGITTIKNIMVHHQIPIVIISSLVQDGYFAFESLRLGVMDFIPKPSRVGGENWAEEETLVRKRVRVASSMQVHRMRRVRRRKKAKKPQDMKGAKLPVVVMGTNLAGPNTIMHIVTQLPLDFPAAVVAIQEIHPRILVPFCSYFNEISPLEVVPINGPTPLSPGKLYVGSTCSGIQIESAGDDTSTALTMRAPEPSATPIDDLFRSAVRHFGENVCGILLTGIGSDGAQGMSEIRSEGGLTIAQLQDCCVYPNLVENAIERNAVDAVMSTAGIADRLGSWVREMA